MYHAQLGREIAEENLKHNLAMLQVDEKEIVLEPDHM